MTFGSPPSITICSPGTSKMTTPTTPTTAADKLIGMKLSFRSEYLSDKELTLSEERHNATFVMDTEINDRCVSLFYAKEEHPVSKSHYFIIYRSTPTSYIIDSGEEVANTPIVGVLTSGDAPEVVYSRHRHDFRWSVNGEIWVDGGRQYLRTNVLSDDQIVTLGVQGQYLTIQEIGVKDNA